jgi:hypothetical protein
VCLSSTNAESSVVPLAVGRLISWNDNTIDLYAFIEPQLLLQAEMYYTVVSATVPCLGMFLEGASPDFLGGRNYIDPMSSATASAGASGRRRSAYKMSNLSDNHMRSDGSLRLTRRALGETVTQASKASVRRGRQGSPVGSEDSETAIVVQRSVDVSYVDGVVR